MEVLILSRLPAQLPNPESGALRPGLSVTYSTAARPPRTVFVPGDAPSEDEIAAAIRADLDAADGEAPATLSV